MRYSLGLSGRGGRFGVSEHLVKDKEAWKYAEHKWTEIFKEREVRLNQECRSVENEHGEPWWTIFPELKVEDELYDKACFREVSPEEYYKDIFPPETIEEYQEKWEAWEEGLEEELETDVYGKPSKKKIYKPTPIVSYNGVKSGHDVLDRKYWYQRNKPLFNDYRALENTKNNRFALCSMCTYLGRQKTANRAVNLHGFCIDLDYVTVENLDNLFALVDRGIIPRPTYIVNSGHGVHIVYVFTKPVPLNKRYVPFLQEVKRRLTEIVWTNETSSYEMYKEKKQFQGIYQCFRMPGSWAKFDAAFNKKRSQYIIKAYKVGRKYELSELCEFLDKWRETWHMDLKWKAPLNLSRDKDITALDYERLTLEEARVLYPKWYDRRVERGEAKGHWVCNDGLYNWWLRIMQMPGAVVNGHRYSAMCCLFIYGLKCDIPFELVMEDARNLIGYLDSLTITETNHFTEYDVQCASKYYQADYYTVSFRGKHGIKSMSGIENLEDYTAKVPRNGRKQSDHLKRIRTLQDLDGIEWRNKEGRPDAKNIVEDWRRENPGRKKADCIRETGLSKKTVYKWWEEEGSK